MPQMWDIYGMDAGDYLVDLEAEERAGKRLVIETWVNGYGEWSDESDWLAEWIEVTDYRTGEVVLAYDPEFADVNESHFAELAIVERRLCND